MFKKKNYKIILGIIVGIIISVTGVYAATYYGTAADLTYDNTTSGLSSSNVQDALDELYERANSSSCPNGNYCIDTPLKLGDYVSYTPTVTSYPTDTTKTGDTSSQTINPSELKLWRVLNINDDGTVDIISEYVSSTVVSFVGQTGYLNFVGYLNVLASQYENSTYTVGSRHFGYNRYKSQTQYITDTSKFTNPAPWSSSTSDNSNEAQGGGDTLYLEDYNKVTEVLGTTLAYIVVAPTRAKTYWMASRIYNYNSSSHSWGGRSVSASGGISAYASLYGYYNLFKSYSGSNCLRPIVTLKSGLQYTGEGTSGSPWTIVG